MNRKAIINSKRLRLKVWTGSVAGLIGVFALGSAAYAQTGNVVTDFNYLNATNPAASGAWTYGQVASLTAYNAGGYALTTYTVADTNYLGAAGLNGRSSATDALPGVAKNTTSSTLNFSTVSVPTDHLFMHPGANSEVDVVRFTAATTGFYSFSGDFKALDTSGTTTRGTIKQNAAAGNLFSAAVNGAYNSAGSTQTFSLAGVNLTAGSTVDFAVDYANGTYGNDSTGLALTASFTGAAAPEPGALALIVPGMLGIVGIARRRKAA